MAEDRSNDPLFADWDIESDRSLESFRPTPPAVRHRPRDGDRPSKSASPRGSDPDTCVFYGRDREEGSTEAASSPARGELPRPGDEVGGFRLIAELGRGAFARVFLAEEASLGGRPVALKVSAAEGDEPQLLARLQHAHIVPVHSVRDDPATGLRLLCMPYLGGANLAQVLEEAWALRGVDAKDPSLVEALDQLSRRLPPLAAESLAAGRRPSRSRSRDGRSLRLDPPANITPSASPSAGSGPERPSRRFSPLRWMLERPDAPAASPTVDAEDDMLPSRRFLRRADAVRAAVWVVARLAEGLEHAHSRGLLHRDLKPSNVLIAADGTPMLLDFNLSVETPACEEGADASIERATLGGTLPYMAPEHLDALDPQGSARPEAVDERSDLYSLGLILFEMIAGEPAYPSPTTLGGPLQALRRMLAGRRLAPPSLRRHVPDVPPSLDALVTKCLDPDPGKRHRSAGDLAEDLRRFLDDLPMKHGPEPSLVERGRKWARRHPAACSSTSTAVGAVILIGLVLLGSMQVFEAMQGLHARLKLRKFQRDAMECQFLLNTFGDDDARIRRGIDLAASTLAAAGVDESSPAARGLGGAWIGRLAESERSDVRRSIVELILQDAHARVVLAGRGRDEAKRREAMEAAVARLDRLADGGEDVPSILFRRRSRYRAALGDANGAAADQAEASARPPATGNDWTALGMFHLTNGEVAAAEPALREAIAIDVTSFWAWFALGHCHYEQGRFGEAVGDFTACVVARPDFAWGHFNRGLTLARAGRPRDALDAYDRALALDPDFAEARVDRGLVELELDLPARAEDDLRIALARSRREPRVPAALGDALARQGKAAEAERLFDDLLARSPRDAGLRAARGVVRLRTDLEAAADDFNAVLAEDPRHPLAHYGLARVLRGRDRAAALAHLDQALQADPEMYDAVELRALERARGGDRGARDDVDRLVANPTANRLYNAACALAILGDAARAVELLERSLLSGFPATTAAADPDLASLRERADYQAALERPAVAR
ncbi:protein kinase domain-containing protein [Paludisphaera mucosa]|uniref:Tetratricopeptide repeat protein n=1 Tax=Paludisphaera mucosa TaxID=3030827 RepID=A0ABT6FDP1_9BACT|nr:tetratricopeptide repeat protein [Paludisphaera mucosa]MDG3005669.1 tetratricopeptide repeat protein [Paludisphaera mucosa]